MPEAATDPAPDMAAEPAPDPASGQPATPGPTGPAPVQAARPALVEALGGIRGLVDSGLPAAVFVFVNGVVAAVAGRDAGLRAALVAAVLSGVVIVGVRLARRQTLLQAVSGLLVLAVAVFLAARSGSARDFFLPGIFINIAYGSAFLVSAMVSRPLVGYVYAAVQGLDPSWRRDRVLRRAFAGTSLLWAAVFAVRAVVQGVLYALDRPGWLAAARLLMGWPLTVAAVGATLAWVARAERGRVARSPDGA